MKDKRDNTMAKMEAEPEPVPEPEAGREADKSCCCIVIPAYEPPGGLCALCKGAAELSGRTGAGGGRRERRDLCPGLSCSGKAAGLPGAHPRAQPGEGGGSQDGHCLV